MRSGWGRGAAVSVTLRVPSSIVCVVRHLRLHTAHINSIACYLCHHYRLVRSVGRARKAQRSTACTL